MKDFEIIVGEKYENHSGRNVIVKFVDDRGVYYEWDDNGNRNSRPLSDFREVFKPVEKPKKLYAWMNSQGEIVFDSTKCEIWKNHKRMEEFDIDYSKLGGG